MKFAINLQEKLEKSIALLEQFKNGTLPDDASDRELWQALKVKQVWIFAVSENCCWKCTQVYM